MFDKLYHPCPMCRTNLELTIKKLKNDIWKMAACRNCGSEVWIRPFYKKPME